MKLFSVLLFAAGVLFAGVVTNVGGAQTNETTTETVQHTTTQTVTQLTTTSVLETTTVEETTTAPETTVVTTTVAPTTTSPTTTTSAEGTSSATPTWVWVLLALLGAAVIGLAVLLLTRRGRAIPDSERRQRLHVAIASWAAQGWALQSETTDTAVLQRGDEQLMVSVDPAGQIVTRPVTAPPPSWPGTT